ncbi:hypothetical protein [Leptospira terpstrae]|uniref:Uncharacterized protein n=1 Tax=Leptospira terpstrae serovar Hualin str. LT 11-33 = ATCC 700639 TaxID=1257025 RepID=N1VYS8_9LEPT|nr:hypothetical protein [Leptospira terpstrae]EMY61887.1 hypothetical protein LEP1GSC203_3873 [Leptospira terpstrae serovar Hualin str. LT 11-33 = ATCC 700639]
MEIGFQELVGAVTGISIYYVNSQVNQKLSNFKEELNEKIQSNTDKITEVKSEHDRNNDKVMSELSTLNRNLERTETTMRKFSDESSATRDLVLKIYEQIMVGLEKKPTSKGKRK